MSGALVGTWPMVRLAIRRDRVQLPVWIVLLALIPASTGKAYDQLYPTAADRVSLAAGAGANPSVSLLYGPAYDLSTAGGFTAWRYGTFLALLVALMSVFSVTRHTRAEEDTGRLELLGSAVLGRYAPLTAAVLLTAGADLAIGLLGALALTGSGLPAAGSFALGLGVAGAGLVFTAVAAVAAQLTAYSRTANAMAAGALGFAFLLRAVGDSSTSVRWISWLSPLAWTQRGRPFAGEQWWVLLLAVLLAGALGALAYLLLPRRDLGAGLLPDRLGPPRAPSGLTSAFGLAWRLHRGVLIGWAVAVVASGAVFGSLASGIGDLVGESDQTRQIMARLGGSSGLVDAFVATMALTYGMIVSLYAVQATLRMRTEETSLRAEPLLATGVGRLRFAAGHLAFTLLGTASLLAAAGLAMGLTHGLRTGSVGHQVPRVLGGALAQLPATWVVAGVGVLLFGLLPRLAATAWAVAMVFLLLSMFGPVVNAPQAVLDVSPFTHVPRLPGAAFTATPLVWLTVVAVAAVGAGLVGFRRRDIG